MPFTTKLRGIRYLNNIIENDHKPIKRKVRYRQWYQNFETASAIIDGIEAMRMIQKDQLRYIKGNNILAQNNLIHKLFRIAA